MDEDSFIPILPSSTQLHKNSKPMAEDSFIPVSSTSTMIRPRKSIVKKRKKRVQLIVITSSVEETLKVPERRATLAELFLKRFNVVKKKPKKEEYPRGSFWVGERKLGAGGFGTVYLVKTDSFPFQMANKTAPLQKAVTLKYEQRVFSKYLNMCPYIVQCYGHEITDRGVNGDRVYNLLLEFCGGGSLYDRITESVVGLPECEVKLYASDIVSGLVYIHSKNIAHLDIKPANILLKPTGYKDNCLAKIADFGLCKNLRFEMEESPHVRGTYRYMSPEIISDKILSYPADIWALGCTIIEMLTASPVWGEPVNSFGGILRMHEYRRNCGPKIPDYVSEKGRDFLSKCFIGNPRKRWTAKMLSQHPFLDF